MKHYQQVNVKIDASEEPATHKEFGFDPDLMYDSIRFRFNCKGNLVLDMTSYAGGLNGKVLARLANAEPWGMEDGCLIRVHLSLEEVSEKSSFVAEREDLTIQLLGGKLVAWDDFSMAMTGVNDDPVVAELTLAHSRPAVPRESIYATPEDLIAANNLLRSRSLR